MVGGGPRRVVLPSDRVPPEGEVRAFDVSPDLRLLVARVDGRLHALDDVCNHAGCLLSGADQPVYEVVEENGVATVVVPD